MHWCISALILWGLSWSDFEPFQGKLDRETISHRLEFLVKDKELEDYFSLRDDLFIIYDSSRNEEFRLQLGNRTQNRIDKRANLKGAKIAIDPGHLGGPYAKLEGRFIDTGDQKFDEGTLNYLTALQLKELLENEGVEVLLTKDGIGRGAYEIDVEQWLEENTRKPSFRDTYNRLDLQARADKINAFKPDLTVIIHYNAELQPLSDKNYNMVFIPGAFRNKELSTKEDRLQFLRLLLSFDLEDSLQFSRLVMDQLTQELGVPPVTENDHVDYLETSAIKMSPGVYARNLFLTRNVLSPLCYGETLIQNNKQELLRLSNTDGAIAGIPCPSRIKRVANAYFKAINDYFMRHP